MNKVLGIVIVIALVVSFSYGVSVGTYKIFPYEYLNSFKDNIEFNEQISQTSNIQNFESRIDIKDELDIEKIRDELIFYIWNSPPSIIFPTDNSSKILPTTIEKNIIDTRFSSLDNLKQIDKFSIEMENNINSIVYLFHAEKNNNELIIYHQGHAGGGAPGPPARARGRVAASGRRRASRAPDHAPGHRLTNTLFHQRRLPGRVAPRRGGQRARHASGGRRTSAGPRGRRPGGLGDSSLTLRTKARSRRPSAETR